MWYLLSRGCRLFFMLALLLSTATVPAHAQPRPDALDPENSPTIVRSLAFVEFYEEYEHDLLDFPSTKPPEPSHFSAGTPSKESDWRIRLDLSDVDFSGTIETTDGRSQVAQSRLNASVAWGIRAEYMITYRVGAELGILNTNRINARTGLDGTSAGSISYLDGYRPITVGVMVHLTPEDPLDLYVGLHLALIDYGSLQIRQANSSPAIDVATDSSLGLGLTIGADIPVGRQGWLIHGNLRYLHGKLKGAASGIVVDDKFDPFIVTVGLGFRF